MKFYYIEGISKTDTPLFSSLGEQDDYFSERIVADLDVYYPPYFENKIAIPSSGLQYNQLLDLKVNYLSIDFKQKTYYYFIKNIEYITEDEYAIEIEMDTIQTFMFNVDYQHARIRRMTIPRWTNNATLINRDYIRENYGNDNFIYKSYINLSDNNEYDGGFFVFKFPSKQNGTFDSKLTTFKYHSASEGRQQLRIQQDGTTIILIPAGVIPNSIYNEYLSPDVPVGGSNIYFSLDDNSKATRITSLYELIRFYSEKPDLIDMFYIPYNPLKNLTISHSEEQVGDTTALYIKYTINDNDGDIITTIDTTQDIGSQMLVFSLNSATINFIRYDYNLDFIANRNKLEPFNKKYIPQLVDENYISAEFGEKINRTNYPLSKSLHTRYSAYYSTDISSGYRTYRITIANYNIVDYYDTTLVVNTKEQGTIYNDAWKTFASQNQGTLTLGRVATITSGLFKSGISRSPTGFIDTLDNAIQMRSQDINKQNTPDTSTQGNTYSSDIQNKSLDILYIYKEVSNIQDVATIYESIGYRVDKFVKGTPLSLNNRYYYNYYECSEIDIVPYAFITTEIEDDIKERWNNGLRFWTWHPDIEQFMGGTGIGNICEYDNVEIDLIEE